MQQDTLKAFRSQKTFQTEVLSLDSIERFVNQYKYPPFNLVNKTNLDQLISTSVPLIVVKSNSSATQDEIRQLAESGNISA